MFDDTPASNTGTAPNNLPVGEPEDIFATSVAGEEPISSPVSDTTDMPPIATPSALDAGVLQPKRTIPAATISDDSFVVHTPPEDVDQENMVPRESPSAVGETYKIRGPIFSRGLIVGLFTIIIIGCLGLAGWWVYGTFIHPTKKEVPITPVIPDGEQPLIVPSPSTTILGQTPSVPSSGDTSTDKFDNAVLFGEPLDSDGDSLTDLREKDIGTDPHNWDTDADGLSDHEEVTIWKTDSLNPDTDGDGFVDGQEVKHGYNPTGPGKIFQLPPPATSTSTDNAPMVVSTPTNDTVFTTSTTASTTATMSASSSSDGVSPQ